MWTGCKFYSHTFWHLFLTLYSYRVQVELSAYTNDNSQGYWCLKYFLRLMYWPLPSRATVVGSERMEVQARKFYSQRNMYLCGFTLFLSLILNRTYMMVSLSYPKFLPLLSSRVFSRSSKPSNSKQSSSSTKATPRPKVKREPSSTKPAKRRKLATWGRSSSRRIAIWRIWRSRLRVWTRSIAS